MANVYSVKLYQGVLPGGAHTLYTVPSGYTAVIRSVQLFNGNPYYTAVIGPHLTTLTSEIIWLGMGQGSSMCQTPYFFDCHIVLPAGDGIMSSVASAEASTWQTIISGYQLTLP